MLVVGGRFDSNRLPRFTFFGRGSTVQQNMLFCCFVVLLFCCFCLWDTLQVNPVHVEPVKTEHVKTEPV